MLVYDSSLWQDLVFRLSAAEPAVYDAVVALSAVNQDVVKLGCRVWSLQTEVELLRDYGVLQPEQQRLLSCLNQYGIFLNAFRTGPLYVRLAQQEAGSPYDAVHATDPDACAEVLSPYPLSSGTKTTDT
ncbi:hypothetical protein BDV33DRAFT_5544 [Aspergillus novoparasiticus]|uniref:Uncharacterized protein n=1 Tax=Aspergillus novoparasiticus TaxID=986946 RepID=A0A5N6EHT4_9EURO|nr:hypothetical protein BDV33DRAFT_5544 [Aspergillus novoparasiticus]